MEKQIQYFQIANLIFTTAYNQTAILNGFEIEKIQKRFQDLIKYFENPDNIYYSTNFIKNGNSKLPYNSMTIIGKINQHMILHFTFSYQESILFIIDTKENKIKNYIDIESAKGILDDEIFQDMKDSLSYPKNLNHLFKGIHDINQFVQDFEKILQEHNNPNAITGRDCFEIDL